MITTVLVKYGKPVILLPHRYLRLLALVSAFLHAAIILYVLELLNLALEIKARMGDYIDLLLESGIVLPLLTAGSGVLSFAYNIFTIITVWKSFNSTNKFMSNILFANVIICIVVLISMIALMCISLEYGHNSDPKYLQYLLEAMGNYSSDGLIKTKIDKLQFEFQCCGSRNYSDWYEIDWYDKNFEQQSEVSVYGEAPFSCCSIQSPFPCIHHGTERGAGAYKYTNEANFSLSASGCFSIIEVKKRKMSWNVTGYIFGLFLLNLLSVIPLRFIQTAHIERGKFDKETHIYTAWIFGIYGGKKRILKEAPPVPPLPPELQT